MHIHLDELHHVDDCEICVIIQNFNSADIPALQIEIASLEYTHCKCFYVNAYIPYKIQKGFHSTAPPLS